MTGVIQCGPSRFIRESENNGRKHYRVEADVLPYFGNTPKPGAVFVHQVGRSSDAWETIEARNQYPEGIYNFRGRLSDWPYEVRA